MQAVRRLVGLVLEGRHEMEQQPAGVEVGPDQPADVTGGQGRTVGYRLAVGPPLGAEAAQVGGLIVGGDPVCIVTGEAHCACHHIGRIGVHETAPAAGPGCRDGQQGECGGATGWRRGFGERADFRKGRARIRLRPPPGRIADILANAPPASPGVTTSTALTARITADTISATGRAAVTTRRNATKLSMDKPGLHSLVDAQPPEDTRTIISIRSIYSEES